jgi:uncharacterized phage-associated protein
MTQEVPERPPIRRIVLGLLDDYGSLSDPLLVAITHAEADAAPWIIRATVSRMESHGAIRSVGNEWVIDR